jgi:ATP-dependent NAD(P)H-hydrate dehydratase
VAAALSGPVLLSKGQHDIITDGRQLLLVTQEGSPRRCGGQGDVLTGKVVEWQLLAVAAPWSNTAVAAPWSGNWQ